MNNTTRIANANPKESMHVVSNICRLDVSQCSAAYIPLNGLAAVGNQLHAAPPGQSEFEADQLPDKSPQGRAFRIHSLFVPNGKDRRLVGTTSSTATSGSSRCEGLDVFFSHFCLSE